MTASKDPQSQAEKEIEEAVKNASKSKNPIFKDNNNRSSKRLLWTSVAITTLLVLVMWGWNIRTAFYDLQHNEGSGEKMISETQQSLKSVLSDFEQIQAVNSTSTSSSNQEADKDLESSLNNLLKTNTSTTSSKKTTTITVTSTINSTSSTKNKTTTTNQ